MPPSLLHDSGPVEGDLLSPPPGSRLGGFPPTAKAPCHLNGRPSSRTAVRQGAALSAEAADCKVGRRDQRCLRRSWSVSWRSRHMTRQLGQPSSTIWLRARHARRWFIGPSVHESSFLCGITTNAPVSSRMVRPGSRLERTSFSWHTAVAPGLKGRNQLQDRDRRQHRAFDASWKTCTLQQDRPPAEGSSRKYTRGANRSLQNAPFIPCQAPGLNPERTSGVCTLSPGPRPCSRHMATAGGITPSSPPPLFHFYRTIRTMYVHTSCAFR